MARARLSGTRLTDLQVLYVMKPGASSGIHFGSRLAFAADGTLLISLGERGDRDRAQDLGDPGGSILRLTADGRVPPDNPFAGRLGARRPDALPEIFSYGHRNPQGLAVQPGTGWIWEVEHGPRGGDELNLVEPGRNYGWPVITYGREYSGGRVGEGLTEKEGMEQPAAWWVPSISPSGMAFYTGDAFPGWQGNLFVGALSGQQLRRLELEGRRVDAPGSAADRTRWAASGTCARGRTAASGCSPTKRRAPCTGWTRPDSRPAAGAGRGAA